MTKICAWCGKEFTPNPKRAAQRFCCYECKVIYHAAIARIKNKIKHILKTNPHLHVEEDKLKKIINAKMLIFHGKNKAIHRCPCDALNPLRFCGSKLCQHDILYDGHCHCNLFLLRENKDEI